MTHLSKLLLSFFVLFLISIPTYSQMIRPGIFTMHDFHVFRQHQFDKCIQEGVFPCRWSPDSGKGYGEPVFIFYAQFPYWLGQIPRLLGFSILSSVKIIFALSIVASGFSMFLLSRKFWGNIGGLISSTLYMYAPYRAVDVWVRGALPESLGFIFFPLCLLFSYQFFATKKSKHLIGLSLSLTLLIITHNLSMFMFAPFLSIWIVFWAMNARWFKGIINVFLYALFSIVLSSFYLLPVIFESHLVTLTKTTTDYYQYAHHFVTLKQLFISNFWGYGGSSWGPNDSMSFAVGYLHWMIPVVSLIIVIVKKFKHKSLVIFFSGLSLVALFLTHGKSNYIWSNLPGISFVQFPWRFLSMAVLFLSLCSGALLAPLRFSTKKILLILLICLVCLLNFSFFRPDIWRSISDSQQFEGLLWDEQRSSALQDFWPVSAPSLPTDFAPINPTIEFGEGFIDRSEKKAHSANYNVSINTDSAQVTFPIVYFPGWTLNSNGTNFQINPDSNGLITTKLPGGEQNITLNFTNTPVRLLGNSLSFVSLLLLIFFYTKNKYV